MVVLSIPLPILAFTIYLHVNLKQILNVCEIHLNTFEMHFGCTQLPFLGLRLNTINLHLKYISDTSKCISNAFYLHPAGRSRPRNKYI